MRWNHCNILYLAPDAKRLWQFDAKGGGFALGREQRVPHTEALPGKLVAKGWSSLWQPRLNVAWLPPESVFLRVVELPASNFEETLAMVELQLEKLSPLPLAQMVWTMHPLGNYSAPPKGDAPPEPLQMVAVVIAERRVVEEFAGRLERDGFLADRLETPMLDQLEALPEKADGAWLLPFAMGGQTAALAAFRLGGVWRNLSLITLPAAGDRVAELQDQLSHIAWSGELEGWLSSSSAPLAWHLVTDPASAQEWEPRLGAAVGAPVAVVAPPAPAELAARTARRAAAAGQSNLLPAEFTARYRQQFVDRLWLRGLLFAGLVYAVFLAVYFTAVAGLNYRTSGVEKQVAALGGSYTNALQLRAVFNVLTERQQLKYAALDSWRWVAQTLPPDITLQRFSFSDGHVLTLGGTVKQEQITTLFNFNEALKKKQVDGRFVFDQQKGETVNPKFAGGGDTGTWSLTLELLHAEVLPR